MRLLFISTTFPDTANPTRGTYNAALCRELARDHEVRVISPQLFTESIPRKFQGKRWSVPPAIQELEIQVEYPTFWYTPKMFHEYSGSQMWWSVRKTVERAVREFQPDAVLSYWAHPEGEIGVRAGRLAQAPAAVIVGGTDVLILPNLPKRGTRVRRVLTDSDAVITVSDGLKQAAEELPVPAEQVRTIYQGIDDTHFHTRKSREESRSELGLATDTSHLVWVGRIVPIKALEVLLRASAALAQRQVSFQLHLLGNGPERPSLEKLAKELGLENIVRIQGAVGHDRLADWYRAADLTVMSSLSEGLPNVLRESLACGTPFVSTDVGSIREIARPEYSQLVPVNDVEALAKAIEETLHPDYRDGAKCYQPRTWSDCASEV
ncbi:MAG: glycosyltransferase, partial [Planctomycetaceae bacterium]|nr:glycosyltransferase [Planctomycetaceae bacterium]